MNMKAARIALGGDPAACFVFVVQNRPTPIDRGTFQATA
jgi:hypothetical protein